MSTTALMRRAVNRAAKRKVPKPKKPLVRSMAASSTTKTIMRASLRWPSRKSLHRRRSTTSSLMLRTTRMRTSRLMKSRRKRADSPRSLRRSRPLRTMRKIRPTTRKPLTPKTPLRTSKSTSAILRTATTKPRSRMMERAPAPKTTATKVTMPLPVMKTASKRLRSRRKPANPSLPKLKSNPAAARRLT